MRRFKRATALFLALMMVLSIGIVSFAEEAPNEQVASTGFYIRSEEGNKFIDIYSYLNGDYEQYITDAGLENILFVHQSGKGATLDKILEEETINDALEILTEDDFEEEYMDVSTNKSIKPVLGYVLESSLDKEEYKVDDEIIVTGKVFIKQTVLKDVDITFKATDNESGETLILLGQTKTDENGEFSETCLLPEDTEPGKYTLTVKANEPVNKEMELSFEIIIPEPTIVDLEDQEDSVWHDGVISSEELNERMESGESHPSLKLDIILPTGIGTGSYDEDDSGKTISNGYFVNVFIYDSSNEIKYITGSPIDQEALSNSFQQSIKVSSIKRDLTYGETYKIGARIEYFVNNEVIQESDLSNLVEIQYIDNTEPELKDFIYEGETEITITVGEDFTVPTVTTEAGIAVTPEGEVDTSTPGEYKLTYRAEGYNDLVITVIVKEKELPPEDPELITSTAIVAVTTDGGVEITIDGEVTGTSAIDLTSPGSIKAKINDTIVNVNITENMTAEEFVESLMEAIEEAFRTEDITLVEFSLSDDKLKLTIVASVPKDEYLVIIIPYEEVSGQE